MKCKAFFNFCVIVAILTAGYFRHNNNASSFLTKTAKIPFAMKHVRNDCEECHKENSQGASALTNLFEW